MSIIQTDLFNPNPEPYNPVIELENATLLYFENYFSKQESDKYFNSLIEKINWKQDTINMYGRVLPLPRLSAWYGDDDKPYTYSGINLQPNPWSPELLELKSAIEKEANTSFSSVLLNRYRDGKDYVGWHTDAEKELGQNPIIGSVNFGASRKFQLRRIHDPKEKFEVELGHGSLLVMMGETQHYWQHQVPKTAKKIEERINLTFRKIIV
jgi:alkylated DNA repair dioxygenase AlkB